MNSAPSCSQHNPTLRSPLSSINSLIYVFIFTSNIVEICTASGDSNTSTWKSRWKSDHHQFTATDLSTAVKKESHGWSWDRDDPDLPTHVCSCQGCLLESQPTSSVPACELSRGQALLLADRALDASDDDFVRGENGTVPTQRYLQRSTGECVP
jgi:hypothetical protein